MKIIIIPAKAGISKYYKNNTMKVPDQVRNDPKTTKIPAFAEMTYIFSPIKHPPPSRLMISRQSRYNNSFPTCLAMDLRRLMLVIYRHVTSSPRISRESVLLDRERNLVMRYISIPSSISLSRSVSRRASSGPATVMVWSSICTW